MAEHVRRTAVRSASQATPLSVIGELLITLAVILGLFAGWQLYWTTWLVEAPKQEAITQFEHEYGVHNTLVGTKHTEDPPQISTPANDEVYGLLHVPSWDWMKMPLGEGTSGAVLDRGYAGHYETTAQVGEVGNFSVAAHRRTYGNNFRQIDKLTTGDEVVVETKDAYYVYTFQSNEIVTPDANWVVAPVPGDKTFSQVPTERIMTLTTCHPEYSNTQRFIVHMRFEYWTPKSEGLPPALADEPQDNSQSGQSAS